jgi:hypothetical protein
MADRLSLEYAGSKITLSRIPENKFFIKYKTCRLDIGDQDIEKGLMKALVWFGDIRFKEGQEKKDVGC